MELPQIADRRRPESTILAAFRRPDFAVNNKSVASRSAVTKLSKTWRLPGGAVRGNASASLRHRDVARLAIVSPAARDRNAAAVVSDAVVATLLGLDLDASQTEPR